ncbi:MAG: bifunctional riboflavin kinase/FAD synthetase [Bacteroidetes bacterium]|nr:MAG: bifunctional riboflavin kinase/FAD synthetase [Bacteroidota bacterium]MBL1144774.1 bifunctional riboflavin kinase/FAD synthetase [Bacteroidota bacterium]NOG57568.1 bifunctional riboflavin kinase/FAD synthetase [Bacteroidota bacterium]
MKVYHGIDSFVKRNKAVVTTGTFDGVHIGHRKILNRLIEVAQKNDAETVLLTFFPHPRMVLNPDSDLQLLNTIDEKVKLLEKAGIEHLIIHPFTKKFSRISSLEFVRDILVNQLGTKKLVIGYDHHFGRNREGSFEHLMEFGPLYGFEVEEIPAQEIEDVNVSSTKIRNALLSGDIQTAMHYLGQPYSLTGTVVKGQQLGRELGFPTANLKIDKHYKLIPAHGVYAVYVKFSGQKYHGMMNIGFRPSISDQKDQLTIEVNIFDFNDMIYGQTIQVELMQRIRDEKKFETRELLTQAIRNDQQRVKQILK